MGYSQLSLSSHLVAIEDRGWCVVRIRACVKLRLHTAINRADFRFRCMLK